MKKLKKDKKKSDEGRSQAQAKKFADKLISSNEDREKFMSLLFRDCEQASLICLHTDPSELPFPLYPPFPDQASFVARPMKKSDATKSELHQSGAYYCLDYSSILECTPLLSINIDSPVVLDLCAAPGGKSLFAWKTLKPRLLLSNEVSQGRVKMLISNLKRCGVKPTKILSQPAQKLVSRLEDCADVILVDAPCTGQSLIAKKQSAPGAFSSHQINKNAMRQRGILGPAAHMLRAGGFILYTTCTYSREENEDVIEWFLKKHEDFSTVQIDRLERFQSTFTDNNAYRFWPNSEIGAGGFSCLLKKVGVAPMTRVDLSDLPAAWSAL